MQSFVGPGEFTRQPAGNRARDVEGGARQKHLDQLVPGKDLIARFDEPDAEDGLRKASEIRKCDWRVHRREPFRRRDNSTAPAGRWQRAKSPGRAPAAP